MRILENLSEAKELIGQELGVSDWQRINQRQISDALQEPVQAIIEAVTNTLENSDPELAADIVDKGIVLTGGGSLLGELDQVIRDSTGLPVSIADDPLSCVVQGTGKCAENLKDLRSVLSSSY